MGDNHNQNYHLGGISSDMRSGVTFSATLTRHRKTKFSFHISDDIPPQIRILNTVVPPMFFLIIVYLFIFTMTLQVPTFVGSF